MARASYGPQAQKQASCLLAALLTYANDELEDRYHLKIECNWQLKNQLIVKTTVRYLESLVSQVFKGEKLTSEQIKESLKRYKEFLEILDDHRMKTQGSDDWHFTLKLWFGRHEKAANLQRFAEEWERCRSEKLGQVTEEAAKFQPGTEPLREASELERLVQSIRKKVYDNLQVRCGTMRVLDMSQPIRLDAIYTTVSIYESISARQRRGLTDLLQQFSIEDFSCLNQQETRISGLTAVEQYSKLMILGKPGAGKTVFLKWLAIQCNSGHLWADLIPVFITVKAFAEAKGQPGLLGYIHQYWDDSGVLLMQVETLLKQGRALILLDGLDEVREIDYNRVLQEIREFSTQFHTCRFVMTCRIAAQEYTFEQFTEVEIADFDNQQMTAFVAQWFEAKNIPEKAARFLEKLHNNQRIQDLATNPLLLTLLCLVFQASADFPSNRSEIYREGLKVLLRTWDARRNIERDGCHQRREPHLDMSPQRQEALLSQIAFTTFERGDYFFKQQAVEQYIAEFLRTLTTLDDKQKPLEIDSEAVLKSIEAQNGLLVERARGIYSFAHLTFHEYFTARKITSSSAPQLEEALHALAKHVTEKEWHEVFLLTVSMLQSADALLHTMKAQIDGLLSSDAELQQFLIWLNGRAISAAINPTKDGLNYKPAIVRAYHSFLVIDSVSIKESAIAIASAINRTSMIDNSVLDTSSASDTEQVVASVISSANDNERAIGIAIVISSSIGSKLQTAVERTGIVSIVMDKAIVQTSDPELRRSLQDLKRQLPDLRSDPLVLSQWWQDYGHTWTNQLRDAQIRFRNLVYDYRFSESQRTLLDQYYRANLLLINCLNSDCNVSQAVRDELEATLLSPL